MGKGLAIMRRTDDTIYIVQNDAACLAVEAVRARYRGITQWQAEAILWMTALADTGNLEPTRRINLTCLTCKSGCRYRDPAAVAREIHTHHRGHEMVIGISNPQSTPADVADERIDLPVGDAVVSITSGRGEK